MAGAAGQVCSAQLEAHVTAHHQRRPRRSNNLPYKNVPSPCCRSDLRLGQRAKAVLLHAWGYRVHLFVCFALGAFHGLVGESSSY